MIGLTQAAHPSPSMGSGTSGGAPGSGGSGSTGSGSGVGSGGGSMRHSKTMPVSGVVLSVALKTNVASRLPVGLIGALRMRVMGASVSAELTGGVAPPPQTTPIHCSGSALPLAMLPLPSMLMPGPGTSPGARASPALMPKPALL